LPSGDNDNDNSSNEQQQQRREARSEQQDDLKVIDNEKGRLNESLFILGYSLRDWENEKRKQNPLKMKMFSQQASKQQQQV